MYLYICQQIEFKMNKYRITNPNNKEVRECLSTLSLCTAKKSRTTDKEMGMEIIKQLYDIGCIFDYADNTTIISTVFDKFVTTELNYRKNLHNKTDVIDDIIDTSLEICLRGKYGKADFEILQRGIVQVTSFIFSEKYHIEKEIVSSSKVAYLAAIIKHQLQKIEKYNQIKPNDMKDWKLTATPLIKLNKLKKTNTEAFFYLYKFQEINY